MFSVLITTTNTHTHTNTKGHKETFRGDGYVYDFHCGGGITGACICPNSSNCTH